MRKYVIGPALVLSLISSPAAAEEGTRFREAVTSTKGVVASISDLASRVGVDVLDRGGNAIDAAVATVLAVGVARPEMGGLGGAGFLLYRGANNQTAALDFREESAATMDAHSLAGPGMHNDTDNCGVGFPSGHRTVGVPGLVAGMESALERFGSGKFTLGELITNGGDSSRPPYAYELARDGFTISAELRFWLFCEQQRLQYYPETRRTYAIGSGPSHPYDRIVQEEYARSLLFIAEHGADAFYEDAAFPDPVTGLPRDSIGRLIAADMARAEDEAKTNPVLLGHASRWGGASNDKGFLTIDDFTEYQPIWRKPLTTTYHGHRVITMPPPTSGGIAAIEILNLIEEFPLGDNELDTSNPANADTSWAQSSANHLHLLAEAQKLAWADRDKYVADPDFTYDYDGDGDRERVPTRKLTSKEYADSRRDEIDLQQASFAYEPGVEESSHTNHISVLDAKGNAVSVTTSLGAPFGSVVMAPGTGFLLNNEVSDFNMTEPDTANAPGPSKRPRSSQASTIVVRDDEPVLVVGAAGGPLIPLGVVQMIVNTVDFGLDIAHAIDAERVEAVAYGDVLSIEAGDGKPDQRIPDAVLNELESRGHTLSGQAEEYVQPPIVEAVGVNLDTGLREAMSDPRNDVELAGPSGPSFGQGACAQGYGCRPQG